MKILIVSQYFYPERFLLNDLVKELVANGHEVTVLTGQPNYPGGQIFPSYSNFSCFTDSFHGARVLRVPIFPRGRGRAWELALNYLSFILSSFLFGLPRLLFKPTDIIFSWGTSPILQCVPALFLNLFKRKKTYLWVQDLWPETLTSVNMIDSSFIIKCVGALVKIIYKLTDFILIQSPAFKLSVMNYGGREEKIHWVPNWSMAPVTADPNKKPMHTLSKQHFNLLFAGNLGRAQSLATILDAAEIIKPYDHIKINILGEGSEKEWFERTCRQRNINNVSFYSGRPTAEMPFYFSQAQALLITLKKNSTLEMVIPSKVQSYLAAGKPIVASLSGQAQKILTESGAALVGPAEDPRLLAENIKKLATYSDEKLEAMGEKGRLYNARHFDRKKVIDGLIQLFQRGLN